MDDEENISVPDALVMMDSATVVEMSMNGNGTVMVLLPGNSGMTESDSPMLAKLALATGNAMAQLVQIENAKSQKRATQIIEKLELVSRLSEEDSL